MSITSRHLRLMPDNAGNIDPWSAVVGISQHLLYYFAPNPTNRTTNLITALELRRFPIVSAEWKHVVISPITYHRDAVVCEP